MGNGPIYPENAILLADLRASGQNEALTEFVIISAFKAFFGQDDVD
jgi:hypothetical protein